LKIIKTKPKKYRFSLDFERKMSYYILTIRRKVIEMIVTNLKSPEIGLYTKLNKYFDAAFEAAQKVMVNTPEPGRYDIDGDNCYYMVQRYDAKSPFESQFESHRDYIDIQIMIKGEEIIRFEDMRKLSLSKEYTPDYELFTMNKDYDSVRLTDGELVIIFPGEPHAPGIRAEGTDGKVCKMVVKIRNL
jgi:YhcH/YjgK/YiaL family protein